MQDRDGGAAGGLYVLFVRIAGTPPVSIDVGALGSRRFEPGLYGYVGSANGPGGFARLDRHVATASGDQETRHWHIDYLLAADRVHLAGTSRIPGRTEECALARALPGSPVPGIGASDCACSSHLFALADRATARAAIDGFAERDDR